MLRLPLSRHLRAVLKRTLHPGYGRGLASRVDVSLLMQRRLLGTMRDGGFWHNGPLTGVQSGQVVGIPSSEGVTGDVPLLPWYGLVSILA